jgi:protein gp37
MAERTGIEWTDATVNFWWGCTKVGPGCDHCYAETWAARFGGEHWGVGAPRRKIKGAAAMLNRLDNDYADWAADAECRNGNAKAFGLPAPRIPLTRRVFIQSMSDLFDTEVPLEWFAEAWGKIVQCDRIDIQIVTKRISVVEKRLAAIGVTTWPKHAGLLVTVCNQDEANRDIPRLIALKAKLGIPWVGVSAEPLLGPIDFTQIEPPGSEGEIDALRPLSWQEIWDSAWSPEATKLPADEAMEGFLDWYNLSEFPSGLAHPALDWIIVGGESGKGARPIHPGWARAIRDQCAAAGTAFFFKQWGEYGPCEIHPPGTAVCSVIASSGRHLQGPESVWGEPGDERAEIVARFGKARAGRLLDGVEHSAMPEVRP